MEQELRKRIPAYLEAALTKPKGKLIILAGGSALLALLAFGVPKLVQHSAWYVGLHSDVQWHRDWQDEHRVGEAERVREIYRGLSDEHPQDPNYVYLKIRGMPEGAAREKAWSDELKKFPESPWLSWGKASTTRDPKDLRNAIRLFSDSFPVQLVPHLIELAASNRGEFVSLVQPLLATCVRTLSCTDAMANAEFSFGNWTSAVAWDELALRHGSKRNPPLKKQVDVLQTLGFRNTVMQAPARGNAGVRFRIVDVRANETKEIYGLVVTFEFTAGREEAGVWGVSFDLLTSAGVAIKGDEDGKAFLWFMIQPFNSVTHQFVFGINKGATVQRVLWDPGGFQAKVALPLRGDPEPDGVGAVLPP